RTPAPKPRAQVSILAGGIPAWVARNAEHAGISVASGRAPRFRSNPLKSAWRRVGLAQNWRARVSRSSVRSSCDPRSDLRVGRLADRLEDLHVTSLEDRQPAARGKLQPWLNKAVPAANRGLASAHVSAHGGSATITRGRTS